MSEREPAKSTSSTADSQPVPQQKAASADEAVDKAARDDSDVPDPSTFEDLGSIPQLGSRRRSLSIQDMEVLLGIRNMSTTPESKSSLLNDKASGSEIQTKLNEYNGPNPFEKTLPFNRIEKVKMFFFICTGIVLIKMVIIIFVALLGWAVSFAITGCGESNVKASKRKLECWQKPFYYFILFLARIVLLMFGYVWIPTTNANDRNSEDYKNVTIVVSNHNTYVDGVILVYLCHAAPAAMAEIRKAPIAGNICDAIGTIWINRHSKEGRKAAITELGEAERKIIIFPQGTVCNTHHMTQFKPGAFLPRKPVLPVAIRHRNRFCDVSALDKHPRFTVLHQLCQFVNFVHVDILKVYTPSEEEKKSVSLYASNVRQVLGSHLKVALTQHSFDDIMLQLLSQKRFGLNASFPPKTEEAVLDLSDVLVNDAAQQLKMKSSAVIKLAKVYLPFCERGEQNKLVVGYEKFCSTLGLGGAHKCKGNETEEVKTRNEKFAKKMFEMLRNEESEVENIEEAFLTFEDFLVGVAIGHSEDLVSDAFLMFFSCCDRHVRGFINKFDVIRTIKWIEKDSEKKFEGDVEAFVAKVFNKSIKQNVLINMDGKDAENDPNRLSAENEQKDGNEKEKEKEIALGKDAFYKAAKDEVKFIQSFLQFVVSARFELELVEGDFVQPQS